MSAAKIIFLLPRKKEAIFSKKKDNFTITNKKCIKSMKNYIFHREICTNLQERFNCQADIEYTNRVEARINSIITRSVSFYHKKIFSEIKKG